MNGSRQARGICSACSFDLYTVFRYGFCEAPPPLSLFRRSRLHPLNRSARQISTSRISHDRLSEVKGSKSAKSLPLSHNVEDLVHQTRQTFGETVPKDFLSPDEHRLYERLYGTPIYREPGNVGVLINLAQRELEARQEQQDALLRVDEEGNLEHVDYVPQATVPDELVDEVKATSIAPDVASTEARDGQSTERLGGEVEVGGDGERYSPVSEKVPSVSPSQHGDFGARFTLFKDIAAAQQTQAATEEQTRQDEEVVDDEDPEEEIMDRAESDAQASMDQVDHLEGAEELEQDPESEGLQREHPLTAIGRSGTSPSTIFLPQDTVIEPVQGLLRGASNRHLSEVATKIFGGPSLPDSVATPPKGGLALHQKPVALEATQSFMGDMEGNAYLAAMMPGMYASVIHIMWEVRKRLGLEWLQRLLKTPDNTKILDVGSGGAAVQAWRQLLKTEADLTGDDQVSDGEERNYGKATVVTGSDVLRHRASRLLQDTTFLPRLPDYEPARDHPTLGYGANPQPRKQYDVVVASHSLWHFREDWMRKAHVQNLWSLLKPNGGVLILLEKGLPRGFELIAGAREILLKHHIEGSAMQAIDHQAPGDFKAKANTKEKGMIIAPCTNHAQCPMYRTPGATKGRKDLCHFSQRFIRPPYLQRLLGSKHGNHEDIRFSYIAAQRGADTRESHHAGHGEAATDKAFSGFEGASSDSMAEGGAYTEGTSSRVPVNPLSLPRSILPPIKRHGHVIMDLCTPAAKIERWTVPKSFSKQAYRDARKSKWGDLWALGAKTRIQRNIRLGNITDKQVRRSKDGFETEIVGGPTKEFQKPHRRDDTVIRGKDRGKRRRVRAALGREEED